MATIPTKIKNRIDTIENWNTYDPVLLSGEIGIEGNTAGSVPKMKIGDGTHHYSDLPYLVPTSLSAFTNDSGYAKGFTTETISNTNGHYLLKNGKVNLVELSTELSTTWTEVGNTMWEGTQTESQLDSSTWPVWDAEIGKWTMDGITPGFDGFTSGILSSKGGNQRSSTLNFETVLSCTRDMEIHVDIDALSAYVTFNLSSPVQSTTTYDPEDGYGQVGNKYRVDMEYLEFDEETGEWDIYASWTDYFTASNVQSPVRISPYFYLSGVYEGSSTSFTQTISDVDIETTGNTVMVRNEYNVVVDSQLNSETKSIFFDLSDTSDTLREFYLVLDIEGEGYPVNPLVFFEANFVPNFPAMSEGKNVLHFMEIGSGVWNVTNSDQSMNDTIRITSINSLYETVQRIGNHMGYNIVI